MGGRRICLLLAALLLLAGCSTTAERPRWTGRGEGFESAAPENTPAPGGEESPAPQTGAPGETAPSGGPEGSEEVGAMENRDLRYAWQYLSAEQQRAYKGMAQAVEALEASFTWAGLTAAELGEVLQAIVVDCPAYFWLSAGYQTTTTTASNGSTSVELTFRYNMEASQVPQARAQVEQVAERCLAGVQGGWDDYHKIKWVYDFVIRNTEYDGGYQDQSLYSVLVYGRGVCAGYSRATQYLLLRLGIPCTYVSGTARGGGHAWNLVKAGGEWYYLDATWGDPVFTDSSQQDPDLVSYDYFCVTTAELTRTHTIGEDLPVPQCTARACNYFVYNGLELETYDAGRVEEIILQAALAGENAVMRFTTGAALGDATTLLLDRSGIFPMLERAALQVPGLDTRHVRYSTDDDTYCLTIFLEFTG